MIVLRPDDPNLFRDNGFIREVADEARNNGMPIDLQGSTLAHAYYQLLDHGCTVIATSEKDYSRVRKLVPFGKIVRDKIPEKIASRKELEVTASVPSRTREAFLIGKILEEALEVRESKTPDEKRVELSDLLEIIRALAHANGFSLDDVIIAADKKRAKLGGFERGHVLLQTGIGAPGKTELQPSPNVAQVLARSLGSDTKELPFTFFGFAELEQPRTLYFEEFGLSLELTLKSDRLVVRMLREPEQLELPLSLEVDPTKDSSEQA
jgi:predicted house-cleaning noncanonical NTP pyrophosphatase (MazG superfamily)